MGHDFIAVGTRPLGARTSTRRKFVFGCLNIADHGLDRVANAADKLVVFQADFMFTAVRSTELNMWPGTRP